MKHPKYIKQSKIAINSMLSTRKSESNNRNLTILNESLQEISISEIPKAALTYKGAFPYLIDALSELCTINPKWNNGEYVIKGQNDKTSTHYSVALKWETLTELATDNEPTSKDYFRKEIMKIYKTPPNLYINLGNGHSLLTHPFIIRNIVFDDLSTMTKKEADICARLGITKKISYVDIEFFKPLFNACFTGNEKGGYIETDPASFAKFIKTSDILKKGTEFSRFYNPKTQQFITKYASTYYKTILYLLSHISSNKNANTLTLYEDDIIELLTHVDPAQLVDKNGNTYIRNQYDTKLFIDKSFMIYNRMAQYGYCEHTIAVSEHSIYTYENGKLKITISYKRETPRTNIKTYTSNFLENEVKNNLPLQSTNKLPENF